MTLHKLSAGSGYDYLTRQVAVSDSTEKGNVPLADYYSAKGEAPGTWTGSGLVGIGSLQAGDIVTAEQMLHLFGHGFDPVTGERLGRPYRLYENQMADDFTVEVGRRIQELNSSEGRPTRADAGMDIRARARSEVGREFFVREHGREPADPRELDASVKRYSRKPPAAVAGFDLTFSPVKSVSTLWAIAPRELAEVIESAHQAAVSDALSFIEREVLFTREGLNGARQVQTRGLIAAAFTHRDSRAGDPDLHTHVAVSNKVQTADGNWLSIYGRLLYESVVAASETYNTALERHLSEDLGVRFAEKPNTDRGKRPIREIVGVENSLNQAWSKRRQVIDVRRSELAKEFQQAHGRPPTTHESIALAQQANLETRDPKHEPRSLAEQRTTWHAEAVDVLGSEAAIEQMMTAALNPGTVPSESISVAWVHATAARVVYELEAHRATWKANHVRAEVERQVRGTAIPSAHAGEVTGWVVDDVLDRLSVNLTSDLDPVSEPDQLRRKDGQSVYRHSGREIFTSQKVLDAEHRITTAAGQQDGRTVSADSVEVAVVEAAANGVVLNAGQAALVREMATSGSRVQVAIAAAGSGKTTAMQVLARAWTDSGGQVVGFAASANAASTLQTETGIRSETLAKLVHDLDADQPSPVADSIGPDTLVVIDEAGTADTLALAHVVDFALQRGASVRLVGDDRQLSAIGAGGVLRDIATAHGAVRLDELMRFSDPAEAEASLALRHGDASALGFYFDRDRIHVGSRLSSTAEVFEAWSKDRAKGLDALMLAPTRELVSELNQRARWARLNYTNPETETTIADEVRASVGDLIITRRNDRRLPISATDWVKNGDRWTITGIDDGALKVRHVVSGLTTTLPASYVSEHVDLGYASTVHGAQGLTADTMHGIITGAESRQMLYTMMSRGRHANHLHVDISQAGDLHDLLRPDATERQTATEVLERILARDDAAVSATTTAREASSPATQLQEAVARYADAILAAAQDVIGAERIAEITQHAEHLMPGLTESHAWTSLSAQLLIVQTGGGDALNAIDFAIAYRPLDDARYAAAVLGWRIDGLFPTESGPLPWLPAIPTTLTNHPDWGRYLADRENLVIRHASAVRSTVWNGPPDWVPEGTRISEGLAGDVAIWRATHGIPDHDHRPTGPTQSAFAAQQYQAELDHDVSHEFNRQGASWIGPITQIVGHHDNHTPVLAHHLAGLAQQGIDVPEILQEAARQGHLPDDHATAALASRITRITNERDRADHKLTREHQTGPWRTGPRQSGPGIGR